MLVEQLPSVEEVVSSFEAGRQRLAEADLVGASRSALTSARDAIPDGWPGHRRPSRWPWVAAIILGTTLLGVVLLMAPTFRRYMALARGSREASGDMRPPAATDTMAPADETSILAHPAISDPFSTPPLEGEAE